VLRRENEYLRKELQHAKVRENEYLRKKLQDAKVLASSFLDDENKHLRSTLLYGR